MTPARFEATVLAGHKENAVEVPFSPAERWGLATVVIAPQRRGVAVWAEIDGQAFDSHVVARSGKFWLLLPAAVGAELGACVSVVLKPAS